VGQIGLLVVRAGKLGRRRGVNNLTPLAEAVELRKKQFAKNERPESTCGKSMFILIPDRFFKMLGVDFCVFLIFTTRVSMPYDITQR